MSPLRAGLRVLKSGEQSHPIEICKRVIGTIRNHPFEVGTKRGELSVVQQRREFAALVVALTVIAGVRADTVYPDLVPDYQIELPRDEGSHPQFKTE